MMKNVLLCGTKRKNVSNGDDFLQADQFFGIKSASTA